jgi:DNA-binding beta-propeller fold protein YncE
MGVEVIGRVRAPELTGDHGWLNVEAPLTLHGLRGKLVLLDFWTFCCINCLHELPRLEALGAAHADQLVVIGVHSPKFPHERGLDAVRHAVWRHRVSHPVVNDAEQAIWRHYAVRAWPTRVLIDPSGYIVGMASGEGHDADFDRLIRDQIALARAAGTLREGPLAGLRPEAPPPAPGGLWYPGKVLADAASNRLFVADSGHHRVVIATLDGTVLDVAGTGTAGAADGDFGTAAFDAPQGLALDGETLYVADTGNHLIRTLDLAARRVTTWLGTGRQAAWGSAGGVGRQAALNSPWDLALAGPTLYVAMAGTHQVWATDRASGVIAPHAGSSAEGLHDNVRPRAALAQPSGLALGDAGLLYVADAEVSAVRAVEPGPKGRVRTLVGRGLFTYGDRDGTGPDVRLQHPLGVAFDRGRLYVADTFNHKIRLLDPQSLAVRTLAGIGRPGLADGDPGALAEPGGLSVAGDRLYIADTNNHLIRVLNLTTGALTTLPLTLPAPPRPRAD